MHMFGFRKCLWAVSLCTRVVKLHFPCCGQDELKTSRLQLQIKKKILCQGVITRHFVSVLLGREFSPLVWSVPARFRTLPRLIALCISSRIIIKRVNLREKNIQTKCAPRLRFVWRLITCSWYSGRPSPLLFISFSPRGFNKCVLQHMMYVAWDSKSCSKASLCNTSLSFETHTLSPEALISDVLNGVRCTHSERAWKSYRGRVRLIDGNLDAGRFSSSSQHQPHNALSPTSHRRMTWCLFSISRCWGQSSGDNTCRHGSESHCGKVSPKTVSTTARQHMYSAR